MPVTRYAVQGGQDNYTMSLSGKLVRVIKPTFHVSLTSSDFSTSINVQVAHDAVQGRQD